MVKKPVHGKLSITLKSKPKRKNKNQTPNIAPPSCHTGVCHCCVRWDL